MRTEPAVGREQARHSSRCPNHHTLSTGTPGQNLSYLFDPIVPSIRQVTGTPDQDQAFFISPNYAQDHLAFASGFTATGGAVTSHSELFSCTPTFTCATKLASFDPPYNWVDQLRFAPDFASSGTILASVGSSVTNAVYRIFVSHDRGAHFSPVTTLNSALAQVARYGGLDTVAISDGAPGTRDLFAYFNGGDPARRHAPPFDQLYRSTDDGTTWSRVAYNRCECAARGSGSLPFGVLYGSRSGNATPALLAGRGNELLLLSPIWRSAGPAVTAVWCSKDRGRTWLLSC